MGQIFIIIVKIGAIVLVAYKLWKLSELDSYFVSHSREGSRDRFDGKWTYPTPGSQYTFSPGMDKIHDVFLIIGALLMLSALAYDTVSIGNAVLAVDHICDDHIAHKQAFCEWLRDDVGLIQFLPNFQNAGFDDIRILVELKEKDLREMNITKNGHIKILMKCINDVPVYEQKPT